MIALRTSWRIAGTVRLAIASLSVVSLGAAVDAGSPPQLDKNRLDTNKAFERSIISTNAPVTARARPERLFATIKATEVIGMSIRNPQGDKLGHVDDLAIDLQAGAVLQLILESGGILGVGDRSIGVPPRAFSFDSNGKSLLLDVPKERWRNAPTFDRSKWSTLFETNRVAEIYRFYGMEPDVSATPSGLSPRRVDSLKSVLPPVESVSREHIWKASKLIGTAVLSRDNNKVKLGTVHDLVVDLAGGRLVEVILASGGFLGIGDALSAVPPTAFENAQTNSTDALLLDLAKHDLSSAPHFKSNEWPDFNDTNYLNQISIAHHIEPFTGALKKIDADNTARNAGDKEAGRPTATDQSSTPADLEITRKIRKQISDRTDLSINARNAKVITANGRVTLRGPVNTASERAVIADIASKVAPDSNVENQLEIKRFQ